MVDGLNDYMLHGSVTIQVFIMVDVATRKFCTHEKNGRRKYGRGRCNMNDTCQM